MRKRCTVCGHRDRALIDDAIQAKETFRELAARFGLGRMALQRHSKHSSNVLTKLSPRQAKLLTELNKPQPVKTAMLRAGYSEASASHGLAAATASQAVQEALRAAIQKRVSVDLLAQRLSEGLDSTEFRLFASEGHVVDRVRLPDYRERRGYLELTAKLGGYVNEKASQEAVQIEITQEDVADKLMTRLQVLSMRTKT